MGATIIKITLTAKMLAAFGSFVAHVIADMISTIIHNAKVTTSIIDRNDLVWNAYINAASIGFLLPNNMVSTYFFIFFSVEFMGTVSIS